MQEILRQWKAAHAAITESLLREETITGPRIEQLMDENPPAPELADLSDWTVQLSFVEHLYCIRVSMQTNALYIVCCKISAKQGLIP